MLGLKSNFQSNLLLCSWHIQKNIISHLSSLGKKNKTLYDRVINLPFITCEKKFNDLIKTVEESEDVSIRERKYLEEKLKTKKQWAKCITKENFCGGICTTSRIEGLHGVLKRFLNSNSRLQGVFNCFRSIEKTQLQKFEQEYSRHKKQKIIAVSNPLELIKNEFSDFLYKKIAPKFSKALNYILEPNGRSKSSW